MWDDIAVRDQPPTGDTQPVTEAPENGYGALVVWCAGPAHAIRVPHDDLAAHRVVTETTDAAGEMTRVERPRTQADQGDIDADLNGFLADAGIEPRPAGYRWFITVPPALDPPDRLWGELNKALATLPATATHPRDTRAGVQSALPGLLGTGPQVGS